MLTYSKILNYVCSFPLIVLACCNIYLFLYRQSKYKVWSIDMFYISALLTIAFIIWTTAIIPITDYCSVIWQIPFYGGIYCNQIVGICQASMLTNLYFQLKLLFKFTSKQVQLEFIEQRRAIEANMVYCLKQKKSQVTAVLNISIFIILCVFGLHTYWEWSYLNTQQTCSVDKMYPPQPSLVLE